MNGQKFSVLISADETKVFSFTSGKGLHMVSWTVDCRMDVFDIDDFTTTTFHKSERAW